MGKSRKGKPDWTGKRLALQTVRSRFIAAAKPRTFFEQWFNVPRVRVFEVQSATHVRWSYWLSNRRTLSTGFKYLYPDVREGLNDTVPWFRDAGWQTDRRKLLTTSAA